MDYGDLSGVSAEAVSKWEEISAQTNALGWPVEQEGARCTCWHHPPGTGPVCGLRRVSAGKAGSIGKTQNWILTDP